MIYGNSNVIICPPKNLDAYPPICSVIHLKSHLMLPDGTYQIYGYVEILPPICLNKDKRDIRINLHPVELANQHSLGDIGWNGQSIMDAMRLY